MKETLPISVVVPHHNRSQLLAGAIRSIQEQTAPPAEIIIVDDGSLPEHREGLRVYSPEIRIMYLDPAHGVSHARNTGMKAATQEWVAFLDDDDEWFPDKLERQWKTLREDESLSGVAGAMRVVTDGRADWEMVSHTPEIMTLSAALESNAAFIQSAMFRASCIRALEGFDETFRCLEDQDFWIRLTAAGYRVFYDREPLMILNRRRMKRVSLQWWRFMRSQFQLISKHRLLYEDVLGAGAVHRAQWKGVCRVGIEKGGIQGRIVYACGCLFGGNLPPLLKLVSTGKMQIIPYR